MERVADYPRPPRLAWTTREVAIVFGGIEIFRAPGAWRVMETFHPPTYYLDPEAFLPGVLRPGSPRGSFCEWKGRARYWSIQAGGQVSPDAGWSYPDPSPAYADIADCVAVYAGRMDRCLVGGEIVTPQPGGFYGGWITADLTGPFKGIPGSDYW